MVLNSTWRGRLAGSLVGGLSVLASWGSALGQHDHGGTVSGRANVTVPKIYLDKSPRIVEYQLKRLSNEQLLLVKTATDDKKYLPVFRAILVREGMSRADRDRALEGLTKINQSDAVSELAGALQEIRADDQQAHRRIRGLAQMLLELPADALSEHLGTLSELARSDRGLLASVGYAGLMVAGADHDAWATAKAAGQLESLLDAIALVPSAQARDKQYDRVLLRTGSDNPLAVRRAATKALANISSNQEQTFLRIADMIRTKGLREQAVRTLLSVPRDRRDAHKSEELIEWLVDFAESTPAAQRTTDSFGDAMELVDQLITSAPVEKAKSYRGRLRETVVRVVRIRTVEEEMRYDLPFFAVEAGRPVQVVLINEDIMPHNLVVATPGSLQEVAEMGLAAGPDGGLDGKQYVPDSDQVLFATDMVAARAQERLTFTAPDQPGEYPYVCTFPRHWMRMYGVMVVVEDLDAWLKNPVQPADPVGSNRQFVQSWTPDDFLGQLETGLRGRSPQIGERLFVEASCAQCHRAGALVAGNVGPDLTDVWARRRGDTSDVLREILDPSHRVDDKYKVRIVLTVDGKTITGLVVKEDKDEIALLENPEAKTPTVIPQDEIEDMVSTSNSMMPKGLLDRFSKDEVFELLGFMKSVQQPQATP